ncbi:MAG: amidohydrolase [Saprospiraceae bacterium]
MKKTLSTLIISCTVLCSLVSQNYTDLINTKAKQIEQQCIKWRRHFHEHPELSNREIETSKYIATFLRELGLETRTGIANYGVVGILKGEKPGPVIALRADMDGLPVTERVPLPFASKVKAIYNGQEVGVMHACGHDSHVAMLMSAAQILVSMRKEIKGTILFVFQPSEEGAPAGEEGGAKLMLKEGVFNDPKVDFAFGIHINSMIETGKLAVKVEGSWAAADNFKIIVKGKQTHGARPWSGVDPIVVSAQIINGLQTIVSRQMDLTQEPVVITVGKISGGVRSNIIPEECEMIGTIRTLNKDMQKEVWTRIENTVTNIAESAGAVASIEFKPMTPVLQNDPKLLAKIMPSLIAAAGSEENVRVARVQTGAEDFAYFAEVVPSVFVTLGGMEKGKLPLDAAPHHTPDFAIDESAMITGIKTFCHLVLD